MGIWKKLFGGDPSEEEFASMVADALADIGIPGPFEYDADDFAIVGEGRRRVYLANMYRDYCRAPKAEREGLFAHYIQAHLSAVPETFEEVRRDLYPVIRHRIYFAASKLQVAELSDESHDVVQWPLGEHLVSALAYDSDYATAILPRRDFDKWGVGVDDAREIALRNLRDRSTEPWTQIEPGLYASPWADNYDGARLLLHDVVHRASVMGRHVAIHPNRNVVLLTGSDDVEAVLRAMAIAREVADEDRRVSLIPIVLEDGEWSVFQPEDERIIGALDEVRVQELGDIYAQQQEVLQRALGDDVFVASYQGVQSEDGSVWSYSVLVEGVNDSLLPQTDRVALVRGEETLGIADWNRVHEVMGPRFEPTDYWPPRWRVRAFPSDDEIGRMGLS